MHVSKLTTLPDGLYKLSNDLTFCGIVIGKAKLFYLIIKKGQRFVTMSNETYHGSHASIPGTSFQIKNGVVDDCYIHNTFRFVKPDDQLAYNVWFHRLIENATHLEYIGE